jgi:hypothetical protein
MPSPDLPHNTEFQHQGQIDGDRDGYDMELTQSHHGRKPEHLPQQGMKAEGALRYREDDQ